MDGAVSPSSWRVNKIKYSDVTRQRKRHYLSGYLRVFEQNLANICRVCPSFYQHVTSIFNVN